MMLPLAFGVEEYYKSKRHNVASAARLLAAWHPRLLRSTRSIHERFDHSTRSVRFDFLSLGALVHRLDPGVIPFRKARSLRHPRLRRRIQRRRQSGRLLRPEDRHRHRHGQLSDRRTGAGARPRDRRHPVLQMVRARRRARPQHRHGLQRSRPRRARPVVFYNRANEAGALLKPGDFDWPKIFAARRALVPLRRHLRGPVGHHFRTDHRRHEGREGGQAPSIPSISTIAPSSGPPSAVPAKGQQVIRRIVGQRRCPLRQRGGFAERPRHPGPGSRSGEIEARSRHLLHADRHASSSSIPNIKLVATTLARGAFDQPPRLGRRALARTASATSARRSSSTCSTASAAATASPRA